MAFLAVNLESDDDAVIMDTSTNPSPFLDLIQNQSLRNQKDF